MGMRSRPSPQRLVHACWTPLTLSTWDSRCSPSLYWTERTKAPVGRRNKGVDSPDCLSLLPGSPAKLCLPLTRAWGPLHASPRISLLCPSLRCSGGPQCIPSGDSVVGKCRGRGNTAEAPSWLAVLSTSCVTSASLRTSLMVPVQRNRPCSLPS